VNEKVKWAFHDEVYRLSERAMSVFHWQVPKALWVRDEWRYHYSNLRWWCLAHDLTAMKTANKHHTACTDHIPNALWTVLVYSNVWLYCLCDKRADSLAHAFQHCVSSVHSTIVVFYWVWRRALRDLFDIATRETMIQQSFSTNSIFTNNSDSVWWRRIETHRGLSGL